MLTLSLRPDKIFESVGWSVKQTFAARVWLRPASARTRPKITRRSERTRCDDDGIIANIRRVHETYDYIVDPHTACGFQDIDSDETTVVLATAHPAKFPETIHKAIGQRPTHPALDALKKIDPVRYPLPANAAAVREFIETHAAGRA